MKPNNAILDVKAFVAANGGRAKLLKKLVKAGVKIGENTINMWIYRNSIPASSLVKVVSACKIKDLSDFIIESKTPTT